MKSLVLGVLMMALLVAGIASANPYDTPVQTTPPPAAKEAPAKDTEKDGEAAKAAPAADVVAVPASSSTFLGQPGEVGAWDKYGNPITKPAFVASPDADKVRQVVKGMGFVPFAQYRREMGNAREDLDRIANVRIAIYKRLGIDPQSDNAEQQAFDKAQMLYDDAQKKMIFVVLLGIVGVLLSGFALYKAWGKVDKPKDDMGDGI